MDRETAKSIRFALEGSPFLTSIESALKVKIKVGNISYDPVGGTASVKLEVAEIKADGSVASKEVAAFKRECGLYGLPADALGKTIKYAGRTMKIVGLLPKSRKFPILCEELDGRRIKVTAEGVLNALSVDGVRSALSKAPVFPSAPKRNEKQIMEDIRDIHLQLSPENLTCDGELPKDVCLVKESVLRNRLDKLELELGRKPTDAEIWETA